MKPVIGRVRDAIRQADDLSPSERSCLLAIGSFVNRGGEAFGLREALAEVLGVTPRSVTRCTRALEEKGYIDVHQLRHEAKGRWARNVIQLTAKGLPPDDADVTRSAPPGDADVTRTGTGGHSRPETVSRTPPGDTGGLDRVTSAASPGDTGGNHRVTPTSHKDVLRQEVKEQEVKKQEVVALARDSDFQKQGKPGKERGSPSGSGHDDDSETCECTDGWVFTAADEVAACTACAEGRALARQQERASRC